MTTTHRKTTAAARLLGMTPSRLLGLIRYGLIETPPRDDSGHYLFSPDAIEAARRFAEERPTRREAVAA